MRKELEAFIEESFAALPPSPETEQAKAQVDDIVAEANYINESAKADQPEAAAE